MGKLFISVGKSEFSIGWFSVKMLTKHEMRQIYFLDKGSA